MILIRLMGGLGNQMFQFAAAKSLALRHNTSVKIDLTLLEMGKEMPHEIVTHRNLDLEVFQLNLEYATNSEIEYFNGKVYANVFGKILNKLKMFLRKGSLVIEKSRGYNQNFSELGADVCLVGGWQSEKYFKEFESEIRNDFRFRNPVLEVSNEIYYEILNTDAVCVNVRRGDYVTSPIYSKDLGALSADYYNEGIRLIGKKVPTAVFFVFSDDLAWCKENLITPNSTTFVEHKHAGEKFGNYLQLMTLCKHFVIPNSTFGWWAAWLASHEKKVVIAPKQWTLNPTIRPFDIIPETWICI